MLHRRTGLDLVYTVPYPQGHDIKLNTFKTSVALKFMIILQNLTTTNQRKSGKSKYDRKLTKFDVVTTRIRYRVNGILEILGGRGWTRICPTRAEGAKTSRGSGGMLSRKILKNTVSLMPFPAFWCGFLCMEQVTNEKKILRILVNMNMNISKQNMNRKIARLLSKNCPTN